MFFVPQHHGFPEGLAAVDLHVSPRSIRMEPTNQQTHVVPPIWIAAAVAHRDVTCDPHDATRGRIHWYPVVHGGTMSSDQLKSGIMRSVVILGCFIFQNLRDFPATSPCLSAVDILDYVQNRHSIIFCPDFLLNISDFFDNFQVQGISSD